MIVLSAGLAGIGAVFVTSAVAGGITLELWFLRILVTDGPPPRFEQLMLLAWFAGSFVAARLGGLRAVGVVTLYAVGSVSVVVMRSVIEPALQCTLVARACPAPLYLDAIAGTAWIVPGLVLGAVLARAIPASIPVRPGLVAVSVFAIGVIVLSHLLTISRYTVCFSPDFIVQCGWQEDLFSLAAHIALGVLAGVVLVRLGGRPLDALVPGGLLAVAFLPAPVHQLAMVSGDGLLSAFAFLGSLVGVLTFVLVALALRGPRYRSRFGRGGTQTYRRGPRISGDGPLSPEPAVLGASLVRPSDTRSAGAAAVPPEER